MPCNPSREAAALAPTAFSFVEFVNANTHAFNVAKDNRTSMFGFKYSEVWMPCKVFARGRIDRLVRSVSVGSVSIKHLAKDQLFFLLLLLLLFLSLLFFNEAAPAPFGIGDMLSTSSSLGDFASQESKAAPGDFAI